MPVKVAKNQERAAEDAYQLATVRRRALAEVKDVLVRTDDADHQARQAVGDAEARGEVEVKTGTA